MQTIEHTKRIEHRHLLALAGLSAMLYFYGLGSLPFLGPDEPRYAQVAREMYETGDWVTPRLAGINWFEKPALTYWLAALGYKLLGVSEFAARCGIALLAGGGVLLLYWFGRRVVSARYGYLSAATLLTSGLWLGFARGATFDLPLSVCLEAALLCFFLWERQADKPGRSDNLWWLACFALGGAVLAKGLVGVMLPVVIMGAYLLLTRRWRVLLRPRLLLGGTAIFLLTAALWYAPMLARHGREFVDEFFVAHHFERYTSNKYKHPQPFYFFFLVILAGTFPWTTYLLANGWQTCKECRQLLTEPQRLRLFLWLWVVVPLLFFSFSGSKLPGYILPVFPAVALLIGAQLTQRVDGQSAWTDFGVTFALALVALLGGLAGRRELALSDWQWRMMAGSILLLALAHLVLLLRQGSEAAARWLPLGLALIVMLAVQQLSPALGRAESLAALSQQAVAVAQPGERLIFYINSHHSIDFYAPQLPLRVERAELLTAMSKSEVHRQLNTQPSLLVMTLQRWSGDMTNASEWDAGMLSHSVGEPHCSPGCDWLLLRLRPKASAKE